MGEMLTLVALHREVCHPEAWQLYAKLTLHIKDVTKTIKVLCQPIYIGLPNFEIAVLKDDIMEVHYIGSYRMHPGRSSCLGWSVNGLIF